jgi:hypothetical protein
MLTSSKAESASGFVIGTIIWLRSPRALQLGSRRVHRRPQGASWNPRDVRECVEEFSADRDSDWYQGGLRYSDCVEDDVPRWLQLLQQVKINEVAGQHPTSVLSSRFK